jgi:hypothetical protein
MIANLLKTFLKKALYGVAAALAAILLQLANGTPPSGETEKVVWAILVVPALTGLAAAIYRWIRWNPAKALSGPDR